MKYKSKTVLVTGGAGYIGSHTCKQLSRAGYLPVVFDNLIRGHAEFVKWGPLERGDLADTARICEVLHNYQPEAVLHFAAFAYVSESVKDPLKYYYNNISGTLNLLYAMKKYDIHKLVFSSSCVVFGNPQTIPIDEKHPQAPINPYGHTKSMIETILQFLSNSSELRSISLRYFNAAGADPEGELGECHDPEPHIIPNILNVAAGIRDQVIIFGNDYPTPDGTSIRDYIHVEDLANAHLLALEALQNGHTTDNFNLSNGRGYSNLELIEVAKRVTGKNIPFSFGPRREGDPAQLIGDATKARNVLGWTPNHTSIETILKHAWDWHIQKI